MPILYRLTVRGDSSQRVPPRRLGGVERRAVLGQQYQRAMPKRDAAAVPAVTLEIRARAFAIVDHVDHADRTIRSGHHQMHGQVLAHGTAADERDAIRNVADRDAALRESS